ncbi:peptide-methionine (S)-S-oxide reductase MsrA [Terasakiella sp. A23]|uniref:peptide-methionine (S)-S-oxide reductase MsrA n=1 Tax=Terasakiella sp. FCG-A23 TaxID=3080561 RepID=UPI0029543F6E|nr:peptide-methionine (S)-S-oxide reductase MsrA [Terasakiella sp. A23]MDV7340887.1 peptide-methionine (S)-S-oxide reductase MsrA [Terasakiella sp. A23]
MVKEYQKATFAAGCFWGVEARFRDQDGIVDAQVGYTSGHKENPTYQEVCSGTTGHAEAVEVVFDPDRVSFDDLVMLFFNLHDPTTLNRQGPDMGTQYRSGIYYHSDAQKDVAEKTIAQLESLKTFNSPIVTEIKPATTFYRAEEYHQQYFDKTGRRGSCY